MAEIILITGGARSGKSSFSLSLGKDIFNEKIFIATAVLIDEEMKDRIKKHKEGREKEFTTIEEPYKLQETIRTLDYSKDLFIILDCITVWLGNLYHKYNSNEQTIEKEVSAFISILKEYKVHGNGSLIIITNELGSGIIPENRMARDFRDKAGRLNQALAKIADKVYLCVSGIPVKIKPGS